MYAVCVCVCVSVGVGVGVGVRVCRADGLGQKLWWGGALMDSLHFPFLLLFFHCFSNSLIT